MSWKQAVTALKYPNYRLWFWSQIISLFGTWMESTALGFLIFDLTKSPAYLGLVGFATGVPTWLFMLYAGVIADRMSRRTLLMITQTAMMVLAFVLAALTFLHWVQPWHVLVLAFLLGTANAFEAPARQSFVLEMVAVEDMTNAIALNSAMFNTAMAVGPMAGGLVYAFFGPAWCFVVNGLSFVAVLVALKRMKLEPPAPATGRNSAWADLKEGLAYVVRPPADQDDHRPHRPRRPLRHLLRHPLPGLGGRHPARGRQDQRLPPVGPRPRGAGRGAPHRLARPLPFQGQAPDRRDLRPARHGRPLRPVPRNAPRAPAHLRERPVPSSSSSTWPTPWSRPTPPTPSAGGS